MVANEPAASLATRLRDSTAQAHQQAERSPLMQALVGGHADRARYGRLLQELLPVYARLEARVDAMADHPWLAAAWSPALARHAALQDDLSVLAPPPADPLPATEAYLRRLDEAAHDPAHAGARLLAHVYVRHLGDLSGGQILRKTLARAFGWPEPPATVSGLRFHDFGATASELRARLKGALAALPADGAQADAAVAEACWAFGQHLRLFDELAAEDRA